MVAVYLLVCASIPDAFAIFKPNTVSVGSNTFSTATLQPATSLTATVTDNSINLSWTASTSTFATGYNILRGTASGGPYSQIAQVTPRTTVTYSDTTAAVGTTYFYVLQTYYQSWVSANSNQVSGQVPPISLVQTANGTVNSTSVSATFASTPGQSNLLVAIVGTASSVTINTPSGWTSAIKESSSSPGQAIFYKVAGASESKTVTVSVSSSVRLDLQIYEFDHVATSSPLDGTASNTGFGSSVSSGTVTATGSRDLIIVGVGITTSATFSGWSSSFTEANDFNGGSSSLSSAGAYRIVTSTGNFSTSASASSSGSWRMQIVAFKHA
ncbi:MAG TPA: hypothetical protein VFB90_02380 [Dehalococcoidia bacterium]|nr:hypothetical protein [Dehalococcoidia bacterium]